MQIEIEPFDSCGDLDPEEFTYKANFHGEIPSRGDVIFYSTKQRRRIIAKVTEKSICMDRQITFLKVEIQFPGTKNA